MIVVSDTSPLSALLTVNHAELLVRIFGEVTIPNAVRSELLRFHTKLPEWLSVRTVADRRLVARHSEIVDTQGKVDADAVKQKGSEKNIQVVVSSKGALQWLRK